MLANRLTIKIVFFLALCVSLVAFFLPASAAPTPTINYQGKLTDATGVAVANGTYNMRFYLYNATGGATTTAIWTEVLTGSNQVQVTNGLFSVMLGSTTPLTSVNFNQPLYLGVEIGGTGAANWDGEMSPRKELGTVPAAFESYKLGGVASSSFLRSDQDDTASGLLNFTGGFLSSASSTISNLTSLYSTTTNLIVNGERFTDLTGSGFINTANALSCATANGSTFGCLSGTDWTSFNNRLASSSIDTYSKLNTLVADVTLTHNGLIDTSAKLAGILSDETGTGGGFVRATSPVLTTPTLGVASATSVNVSDITKYTATIGTNGSFIIPNTGAGNTLAYSPVSKVLWHDRLAFNKTWGAPIFETYNGSWASSTLDAGLFSQQEHRAVQQIDGTTQTAARWIWNSTSAQYSYPEWWVIGVTYNPVASIKDFLIESSVDGNVWTTRHTSTGNTANASPVLLNMASNGGDRYIRLTITVTNGQPLKLSSIRALSSRWGDQGGGSEQEYPYLWDANQRIAFGSTSAVANGLVTIGSNTTSAADGLYFGTDTNLYRSAANQLKTDNGLIITGNVGIGTTSPYAKLSITGDLALTGGIYDNNATRGTNGQVLQTTGTGVQWVATSSLGISGVTTFTGLTDTQSSLTANRILFTNSGGTALTDDANFTFDGTNLGLGASNGIAFGGTRYIYASSTNDSIAFGENAGASFNSTTNYNVAVGFEAAQNVTGVNADYNNFMGYRAGHANTGDYGNIFGFQAGSSNTGDLNNIFGSEAGVSNTGARNNLFGQYSGYFNTGARNNFFGPESGYANTGSENSFFGYRAGYANTGSNNNSFGQLAGYFNTGSYNNFLGMSSGYRNTGNFNEMFGFESGANLQATSSIIIGSQAFRGGAGTTVFQAINNTAIGYRAGYNATTSANNNILLGYQAADNLTTGANNIVIGYDVDLVSATAANRLNIGNLIFGTGVDGTGTTLSSGNVGIGTSSPYAKLSVVGNVVADTFNATNASATSTFAGNISVGSGKSYNLNGVVALGANGTGGSTVGLGNTYSNSGTAVGSNNTATEDAAVAVGYLNSATGWGAAAIGGQNAASAMGSYAIGYLNLASNTNTIALGFSNVASSDHSMAIGYDNNATADGAVAVGSSITNSIANSLQIGPSNTAKLTILSTGNVGIGTTSPYAKLSITGDLALTGGIYDNNATRGTNGQVLQTTGTGVQWVATSSLGISGVTTFTGLTDTQSSLTANRILFANSGGTALTDDANFTFDGTNLGLGSGVGLTLNGSTTITSGRLLQAANGDATTPALSFSDDTNTGIYSQAADSIGFTTGGTERVRLTTSNLDVRSGGIAFGGTRQFIVSGSSLIRIGELAGSFGGGTYTNSIGYQAGSQNTGNHNNLMGQLAGFINTGSYNNSFGFESGYNNAGIGNNFFGAYSGRSNTTGSYNNMFGVEAGKNNTTGTGNNFFGLDAGLKNTTGSHNELMGYETGYNLNASATVAIGAQALRGSGTLFAGAFTAINNTAIGYRAGYNATTSANNNILLGYQAADNLTTGSNNIVIGYDVDLVSATAANRLNIGNLIFGTGVDGTGTTLSSGNVGIGTTSPSAKLTVAGDTYISGNLTAASSSFTNATTTNLAVTGVFRDSAGTAGTNGQVLQTTGTGVQWVATSSLGISGTTLFTGLTDTQSSLTANRILFANSGGTALTDDANFTFDGTNLNLGASNGIAFGGTRYIYASSTNDSIAFGESAGATFTSGTTGNVALGFEAGQYASSSFFGDYNNYIGYQAGRNNSNGYSNFFGYQAGYSNTGSNVNLFGDSAGYSNTGSNVNLFGDSAGYSNTGNYSNSFGLNAGYSNTGADNNILGRETGRNNTGSYNNFLGYGGGYSNTGSYNNFLGYSAGRNNTGSHNNLLGQNTGYDNTGNYNEMFGFEAGRNLQATSSIIIGSEAFRGGAGISAFQAINNTAIGYRAGYNATTSANNNILLGYQAADNLTTGSNNIVIGYDVDLVSATAANRLNIGNLIFGTGVDGTGTTLSSGNIGIGTSSPAAKLSVAGNVWLDSNVVSFASSSASSLLLQYFTEATSTIKQGSSFAFTIATSSSASPIFRIDTSGAYSNTLVNGSFNVNNGAIAYNASTNQTSIENLALGSMSFADDAGIVSWTDMGITSGPTAGTPMSYTAQLDGNPILTVYGEANGSGGLQNGAVGIGTTSPYAKLSVAGRAAADYFTTASTTATSTFTNATFALSSGQSVQIGTSTMSGPALTVVANANNNAFSINAPTNGSEWFSVGTGGAGVVRFNGAGGRTEVGGSGDLGARLNISSLINTSNVLAVTGVSGQTGDLFRADTTGTGGNQFVIKSSGNVGIGTTSPYAKLSVVGNVVADTFNATNASATSTFAGNISVGSGKSYNLNGVVALGANGTGGSTVGLGNTYSNSGTAVGSNNTATEDAAVAVGYLNSATGLGSAAIGGQNAASAMGSYAIGYLNLASNTNTIALGFSNVASSDSSMAIGYDNNATAAGAVAVGSNITNSIANSLQIGPSNTAKLTILSTGNVGIGTTSPSASFAIQKLAFSGAGVVGLDQYLQTTNSVDAAVQYGNRFYLDASNTATTTLVGSILSIKDSTTFGNVVRGFEVQADQGTNTQGENTALSGFARTFGVRGTTAGDAGGTYEPAGVYGETLGTTQGNAIRGYSSTVTTASLLKLFQDTSTYTGTGLLMNFGNAGGSFASTTASKFIDLQNAGSSMFSVGAYGMLTIGNGTTVNNAGLQIGYGGICVDNDGSCTATTTGRISAISYTTGNSDLAENYFSNETLKSGEIVYLKGGLSIGKASTSTGEKVIGVVTTKPGLLLGSDDTSLIEGEKGYGVALAGRVPVRLSNENGEIKAGDELMLSSIPGVAMKASFTGKVVGIALEDFVETRAYSDTYINQFGDDLVDPIVTPINRVSDPRIDDGCYYGAGNASGEEECVPLTATTTDARIAEAEALAEAEAQAEALAALALVQSQRVTLANGQKVRVGQVVMFVDLKDKYLDAKGIEMLAALMAAPENAAVIDDVTETVWQRLVTLANNFVDGILSVFTLKADRVEVKNELCVDGVCVNANDLRQLLNNNATQGGGVTSFGETSGVVNIPTPEPEPVIEVPVVEESVIEGGSDESVIEEVVTPVEVITETPEPKPTPEPMPISETSNPEPTILPATPEPISPAVPADTPAAI